jgi:hypothetical protein
MRAALGRIDVVWRYGLLLWLGYLAIFFLLHDPLPRTEPGLLAPGHSGYLDIAQPYNPFHRLNQLLGIGDPTLLRVELLAALVLLFALQFRLVWVIRRGARTAARLPTVLAGAALFGLPLLLLPYLLSVDVYSYISYGRISAVYADNPALTPPAMFPADPFYAYTAHKAGDTSVYGPLWMLISHSLTLVAERLGGGPTLYLLSYKLIALGCHLASATLLWSILGVWKPRQQVWGTLLYAWHPLALIEFAGSAHNDAVMIGLLLAGLWFAQRGRWRWAVGALVGATLIKWVAAVLLPLYAVLLLRQRRVWQARAVLTAQVAGVALFVSAVVYAPYWAGGQALLALGEQRAVAGAWNSLGFTVAYGTPRLLERLGLERQAEVMRPALQRAVGWVSRAVTAAAAVVATSEIWRRPTFGRLVEGGFWTLLLTLLVTPWFWPWYLTWPLALAALLSWRPAGLVVAAFSGTASLIYFIDHYQVLPFLVFPPVIVLLAYLLYREGWAALPGGWPIGPLGRGAGG